MSEWELKLSRSQTFFFCSRIAEVVAASIFGYGTVLAILRPESWWLISLKALAFGVNCSSFYISVRRDAIQYVFRRVQLCPNCSSDAYFNIDRLPFKLTHRSQCVIMQCMECTSTYVYSCKCTPGRCDHRVDCLAIPPIHIPFFYSRVWNVEKKGS